jgi:hypothetical protein
METPQGSKGSADNQGHDDKNLKITIKTTQGDWTHEFPKTAKVQDVIDAVIDHFGFAKNGNYQLSLNTKPVTILQPQRPLVSYGIKDGDVLIFTDLGHAV